MGPSADRKWYTFKWSVTVPVFLCYFHFLRDVGKDLMGDDCKLIRDRLAKHGPMAELAHLRRDLAPHLDTHAERVETMLGRIGEGKPVPRELAEAIAPEALLATLVASVSEAERQGDGCGFPFDRPHLHCLRQMQAVHRSVETMLEHRRYGGAVRTHLERALAILSPVAADPQLAAAADRVEAKAAVFDRLRVAMRIAESETRPGTGVL